MFQTIIRQPSFVEIETKENWQEAMTNGPGFASSACEVEFQEKNRGLLVVLTETREPVKRIRVRWQGDFSGIKRVLGDSPGVERGDLAWLPVMPEKVWTWYLQCFDGQRTHGYGVMTGCNSFCFWQLDREGITLTLDVRNGGDGLMLRNPLLCAEVTERQGVDGESAFAACQAFCAQMCPKPNLPKRPVFGTNNWYYAYGHITRESVLTDVELALELCRDTVHRPFVVIDDGWQIAHEGKHDEAYNGGPFYPASKFGDMESLAGEMSEKGCEPGLWVRPLLTKETFSEHLYHPRGLGEGGGRFLDPSKDEVLAYVKELVERIRGYGYKMMKYDFTAPDMMTADIYDEIYLVKNLTDDGWHFDDRSITNAQIITNLYRTIQEAAGDMLVIGCNTYNHLAAGIHQIQRSGLDTSGYSWEKTRRMGINSLAFRLPQNGTFFITDPDCAAITEHCSVEMNLRYFEACALSGTNQFISVTPGLLTPEQKKRLNQAFLVGDRGCSMEPVDWMDTSCPAEYLANGQVHTFCWQELTQGVRAF